MKNTQSYTLGNYKNLIARYHKRRKLVIALVILAIFIVSFAYLYVTYNTCYYNYNVVHSASNNGDESYYISYRGGVIKYNKDGATAYTKTSNTLWKIPYEMSDPIADVCGNQVVISDRDGTLLYIFNEKGCVGSFTTLQNILDAKIASQGVVAVQIYEGENDYIQLYYEDGTAASKNILVDMKRNVRDNGYLMDLALSKDGKKLAVDFYLVTTGTTQSNIGFFDYGEVGKNMVDNFMGGFPYNNIVIPKIVFLTNRVICAFKDNGFIIYSMDKKPKLIEEKTFNHELKSIFYNEKYIGVVLNQDTDSQKELLLYDLKGKKILDKKLNFTYDDIFLSGNDIVMYNSNSCLILRPNGKEKFKYTFDTTIRAIYSANRLNKYVLVTDSKISEIVLKK